MTKLLDSLFFGSVVVVAVALLFAEPTVYVFAVVLLGIAVIFASVIGWRWYGR